MPPDHTGPTPDAEDWLRRARDAARKGENIAAYDLACDGLEEHPRDKALGHAAVLALARSGATDRAQRLLADLGLAVDIDAVSDAALAEDIAALSARLAKDRALAADGEERSALARDAAALYQQAYRDTGGYYTAVNAAFMWFVAGETERCHVMADDTLDACRTARRVKGEDSYWLAATEAEASLLRGDYGAVAGALDRAAVLGSGDFAALATTRRQLRQICAERGQDDSLLAPLRVPKVVHYCGHMIAPAGGSGRFHADEEAEVGRQIRDYVAGNDVGFAFGSLACGADILFAEAVLDRGGELNVVLPFEVDEFKAISVARGGAGWEGRFDACHKRAASVSYTTEDEYLGDDELFHYCSRLAMGLAVLRATYLHAAVEQAAVWDGVAGAGVAGTGADIEFWRGRGGTTHVIPTRGTAGGASGAASTAPQKRVLRAMLFGDVKGFSKLSEATLPTFFREVMGAFAAVMDDCGDGLLYRNTWGDGLYLVLRDVQAAARCALGLQRALAAIDLESIGLPSHLGLRLGGHVGPVFEATDLVLKDRTYFGTHVTRTARIEPKTPEGEVYVTEPFAALLALDADRRFACDYVGRMPTAKDYGRFRMYVLKQR